jgi:hypothetical protein
MPAPLNSFKPILNLVDPSGAKLVVDVEGSASSVRFKLRTPAKEFFPETD